MARLPKVMLVPVDGSDGADAAVSYAATLAGPLGTPLQLLFAFPKDAMDVFGLPSETMEEGELESYSPKHLTEVRDKRAGQVFARARRAIADIPVRIEQIVLVGDPATAILAHAAKADDPLIVIGSRGLSRFSEMLVGSVSQRVLHHARCPVTLVHR